MFLSKLLLKEYGQFYNRQVELKDGVNLVYDNNREKRRSFKDFIVRIDCILKVDWGVVKLLTLSVVALFHVHNLLHERMVQMILQRLIIFIEICHILSYFEFFL